MKQLRTHVLVDASESARRFGVAVSTVRRWAREKRIPSVRPSREVLRFDPSDVERALARRAREHAGA